MKIIWYHPSMEAQRWLTGLARRLPDAEIRLWQPGDNGRADYAVVRSPPVEMLAERSLKGLFAMGAGVDELLQQQRQHPDRLSALVPLYRLEDTGMAQQMQEYANWCVLGWYRRFADYQRQQQAHCWQPLPLPARDAFTIGVLGAGVLGRSVLESLQQWGFPLRCWSRTPKSLPGVRAFHGAAALHDFLAGCQVVIDLLPATPETTNLVNADFLRALPHGAYFLNLARGAHVVEADLLAALNSGQLAATALDVFQQEPLPAENALWQHPHVTLTPHSAAITLPEQAMDAIASAIQQLEKGQQPPGRVDRQRGY